MASAKTTGVTLEELLNTAPDKTSNAKRLIDDFSASNKFGIVSPTLIGLLKSFTSDTKADAIIIGGTGFCGDTSADETEKIESKVNSLLSITKDKESSQTNDFSEAAGSFVSKVSEIRASYMDEAGNPVIESAENAFMRMIGLPDDKEIGGTDKSLLYIDPENYNVTLAKLAQITGSPAGKYGSDILAQRKKNSSARLYNFETLRPPSDPNTTKQVTSTTDTNAEPQKSVDYFEPAEQMRFYYLKSIPLQDSSIYNCIFETNKIVMKPFDNRAATKINGNKVHTSLIESIIRLRLDRVTGNPGIYPADPDSSSLFSLEKPSNMGDDSVTQIECFLIDKLRKILFQLADNHIIKAKDRSDAAAKEAAENGDQEVADEESDTTETNTTEISEYESEIQRLEILKAKEDAMLFLLKDTSSAYDNSNIDSTYSALQLQEGVIRTSSGFDDILSGPLYSILRQKSDYLDTKISQLKAAKDAKQASQSITVDEHGIVNSSAGDSYVGISSEDFIIYCIALLSINQDYLIGLLTQERRVNMANVISGSILSSRKDPYGLFDKISRAAADDGFPDILDSVNALAVLVANFYQTYVVYCSEKQKRDLREQEQQDLIKEQRAKEIKE